MTPGEMQINGCVIKRGMAEQYLNGAQVRAGFQQVCGIAMAQGLLVLLMICIPTKICYRFHPFYGVEVDVVRHLRRTGSAVLDRQTSRRRTVALPEWMLSPQACDRLSHEERPRIAY